ncbi:hypothetical protein [Epiphyas postvittana nucleopolyhedrovirus]|uniref:RING-type domain-containing protein n=1 Tax=Epiphyas postvittana nucleopolyhedrovirus TaxID=70600 RepID=Q91GL0_NPVEP|nr:hypothetical protein [Epiphyas postvittana nucleopolyhedrovirus]AAK85605.1 unknown [Epiphyas postvittana nucleopolyhedrovirus]
MAATLTGDDKCYEVTTGCGDCVVLTVRRYNPHIVGFAGIRAHLLEKLRDKTQLLPNYYNCALNTVASLCARCRRSLTLFPAVSYLPCGHSCLCTDCDELYNRHNLCFECKQNVKYKLKFKK